jgi:hypothetical protein
MKKILLLSSALSLFATSGCLVSEGREHGRYHREDHYEGHAVVLVPAPPVVVVRPPEIIIR